MRGEGLGGSGISFLKTVNTLLSESTEGRTRHKGGRAFARTVRVRVRVRVGAWMSQHREQSQVGRFTPRPHFIVLTIAQRAHYIAESETACRVNVG